MFVPSRHSLLQHHPSCHTYNQQDNLFHSLRSSSLNCWLSQGNNEDQAFVVYVLGLNRWKGFRTAILDSFLLECTSPSKTYRYTRTLDQVRRLYSEAFASMFCFSLLFVCVACCVIYLLYFYFIMLSFLKPFDAMYSTLFNMSHFRSCNHYTLMDGDTLISATGFFLFFLFFMNKCSLARLSEHQQELGVLILNHWTDNRKRRRSGKCRELS